MKTLLWSITHYGKPAHTASGQPMRGPKGLLLEEVRLISRLLTSGLTCLKLYFEPGDVRALPHSSLRSPSPNAVCILFAILCWSYTPILTPPCFLAV